MNDRFRSNRVGGPLDVIGDDIGQYIERRVTRLANICAGELGEVVRQGEVRVLGLGL